MKMKTIGISVGVALLLSACAATRTASPEPQPGWQLGRVVEVGSAATMAADSRTRCSDQLQASATSRYASVSYSRDPRWQRRIVAVVPAAANVTVGDQVYVYVDRCDVPLETRDMHAQRSRMNRIDSPSRSETL